VDALRYFLLHHYGGIYIDLDLFTYKSLTPLLTFPAVACRTTPTGISNDILFSTPLHSFFTLVTMRLESYNRNFLLPYLTIMYSTGPLFLSAIWIEYLGGSTKGGAPLDRLHVLMQGPHKGDNYGFWKNIQGGSWHGKDMYLMFWLGDHLILATLLGFLIGTVLVVVLWKILNRGTGFFRPERWREVQREQQRVRQRAAQKLNQLA
jgi:mannosyltransferase OCH1-like enzyme